MLRAINLTAAKRFPSRTRERLERALDQLATDGVIRTCQYDKHYPQQNGRCWIDDWLESTILVEPPEIIFERYVRFLKSRAEVVGIDNIAESLKAKRKAVNLSILRAAEQSLPPVASDRSPHARLGAKPCIYNHLLLADLTEREIGADALDYHARRSCSRLRAVG